MRWTRSHVVTLRDAPAEAEIESHKLLIRAGLAKKVAPGIFTYQNLALRALRKIETIIREEMDRIGNVEVLMPMVHPKELWEETDRWEKMGPGLLKFKNRNDQEFCLGATHEEVVTDLMRHDIRSYRDLPKMIYQVQTKYRDEIRPRFALMRGREFIMKDAYSFDRSVEEAQKSYQAYYEAYKAIFDRLGLEYRIVKADSGAIGGDQSHEFHVLAESGEDALMVCGEYAANREVAPAIDANPNKDGDPVKQLEDFETPGLRTIDDLAKSLQVEPVDLVKTMFFKDDDGKPFTVLLRGSDEVNPIKLKNHLGLSLEPEMLSDEEVKALTGASPGSCGPVGLKTPIYLDNGLLKRTNFVVGANKDDFHKRNVNPGRDFEVTEFGDFRFAKEGDKCPECNGLLELYRGIEVGHVFYLGTNYTKPMGANFLDKNGKSQVIEMGCYGIGVSRTLQAAIEQNNDTDGIIWPIPIAPYHVHVCLLDIDDENALKVVEDIEMNLGRQGFECFVDDRKERPGVKFKDADLLGFPFRLTVGRRGLEAGEIEIVNRKTKEKISKPIAEVAEFLIGSLKG